MEDTFKTASDWIRHESRRRSRPLRWVAYGLLAFVFAVGFLIGTSATWFEPYGLAASAVLVVSDLLFFAFALRTTRMWRAFQRMVTAIADRSIGEERGALGDEAWRRSVEMSRRITLEEIERAKYPARPSFEPLEDAKNQ